MMGEHLTYVASGTLFVFLFGFFIKRYFDRVEEQIKVLEVKLDKMFAELSSFKVDVAKSGLENLKNDLAESKDRLLRLENSEERHWATLERLSSSLEAIRK